MFMKTALFRQYNSKYRGFFYKMIRSIMIKVMVDVNVYWFFFAVIISMGQQQQPFRYC